MGRAPCCDKANVKRGPWSPDEDAVLRSYVERHGTGGNWIALPHKAGLKRCGKSCRLRWLNYLRPDIKHGGFTEEEDSIICTLYRTIGSRWSVIASHLTGRTDNDVKNYWNTKLKKKMMAAQTSVTAPTYIHHSPSSTSTPPPPPMLAPKSEASFSMPPADDASFGYTHDSHRMYNWELAEYPSLLLDPTDVNGGMTGYVVSPPTHEDGSAASSSVTIENGGANNGYTGCFVDGAFADEFFLPELRFAPPIGFLGAYCSQDDLLQHVGYYS